MSRTDASAPPLRREADRVDTSRLQVRTAQIRLRKGPTLAERSPIVPGWTFTGLHWSGRRARSTVHTPTTRHLARFPLENSSMWSCQMWDSRQPSGQRLYCPPSMDSRCTHHAANYCMHMYVYNLFATRIPVNRGAIAYLPIYYIHLVF